MDLGLTSLPRHVCSVGYKLLQYHSLKLPACCRKQDVSGSVALDVHKTSKKIPIDVNIVKENTVNVNHFHSHCVINDRTIHIIYQYDVFSDEDDTISLQAVRSFFIVMCNRELIAKYK